MTHERKRVGNFPVSKDGYECGHGATLWHPDSECLPLDIVSTQVDDWVLEDWNNAYPGVKAPNYVAYGVWRDRSVNIADVYIYPVEECYARP